MGRLPGQPALRKRLAVAGVLLLGLIAALLLFWPAPVSAPPPSTVAQKSAPTKPFRTKKASLPEELPLDDEMLRAAASGEHGLALRNRVCKLCQLSETTGTPG